MAPPLFSSSSVLKQFERDRWARIFSSRSSKEEARSDSNSKGSASGTLNVAQRSYPTSSKGKEAIPEWEQFIEQEISALNDIEQRMGEMLSFSLIHVSLDERKRLRVQTDHAKAQKRLRE
jgi:hypothetical protein